MLPRMSPIVTEPEILLTENNKTTNNPKSPLVKNISVFKHPKKDNSMPNSLQSTFPKPDRKMRKRLFRKNKDLKSLYYSHSKWEFREVLLKLPTRYKSFLKMYICKWFVEHLHLRPIKNIPEYLSKRQVLYEVIDEPNLLTRKRSFPNNLVKNFCRGVINFIVVFREDLIANGFLVLDSEKKREEVIR
jgi:hypothetical protein